MKTIVICAIRLYQWSISPLLGRCCRFVPSCSEYFIEAVRQKGVVLGSKKGLWRLLRCHPFSKGGYDAEGHHHLQTGNLGRVGGGERQVVG